MKTIFFIILNLLVFSIFAQNDLNMAVNLFNYNIGIEFDNGDIISTEFDFENSCMEKNLQIVDDMIILELTYYDDSGQVFFIGHYLLGTYKGNICWLTHGEKRIVKNSVLVIKQYELGFRIE